MAVTFALAACGEDDAEVRTAEPATVPEATPTVTATATPAPTVTATPEPEAAEGGAGDEEGIEQRVRYVIGPDGSVSPSGAEVAAFLPVRVTFENRGPAAVEVDLGDLGDGFTLAPGASESVRLSGPRPGRYELRADDTVAVLESTPGGAG